MMTNFEVIAIDDDTLAGQAIKMVFNQKGIGVNIFSSANSALEEIKRNPKQYKMAVIDFQMTEMRGDLLASAVKVVLAVQ
jgi:DNA-binding NtrC family response regulator